MSRDQNVVRKGNIKTGDLSFEEVEKFKYLGAAVTNINGTREEIKHRINMGNARYYSVEKLLSPSLLSKTLKFKVCHGSLFVVMWLADEPREFNLPTFPQRRITYVQEKLPGKYGVHSEEYLNISNMKFLCFQEDDLWLAGRRERETLCNDNKMELLKRRAKGLRGRLDGRSSQL
ncbi:hypothetical protein ANN_02579 [Periplaneta americana]|uniref:Uncharacterized protein n=1 Tax=Periplaneta americana TaxID=6978 RepID=A0ABQ8TWY0_PERAM|nr:hypothetical protein ANN_02579 [Periplaneta americana]